ncbi:glycosyltransferase [Pelotomaculum propionicicum]|uniref:Hyaluronan synthase n=1 Tax=Pelotomaculum propionicicum TaxID=258475 RepID=A0A4Y7RV00_9FIRM|nr:glycosyltransferase [Pelotomaculum propionicicum]NLI14055.1 glycosyltransferase [Peptococcaceae bacterium]TEB12576.1 Hyaluronan synthase [Pelotomaculum propionicicum]
MIPYLVSILLPVYNQKHTLQEAVDSVLKQRYPFIELIVINDGSTDEPQEIINTYDDTRIKYYSREHKGLPRTLNYGLSIARGEYITWTSADNIMLPDMISDLLAILQIYPTYVAAFAGYYHIDANGKIIGPNLKAPFVNDPRLFIDNIMRDFLVAHHCNFGAAFLYRAQVCRRVGGFDPECEGIEDVDYSLRIASLGPVFWLPKLLYKYRLHEDSMTGREKNREISYQQGRDRFWQKVRKNDYGLKKEVVSGGYLPD